MKLRMEPLGYTIVEVLIFLAVSGGLAASAFALISGKQQSVEFNNAVRDFDNQLHDIANDVATGYFSGGGSFQCDDTGSGSSNVKIKLPGPTTEQGTSYKCILLGRVFQFARLGEPGSVRVYNIAGLRQFVNPTPPDRDVLTLAEAEPVVVAKSKDNTSFKPDVFDDKNLDSGVTIDKITYLDSVTGTEYPIGAFGFLMSLPGSGSGGGLASGSATTQVMPITSVELGEDPYSEAIDDINNALQDSIPPPVLRGNDTITVCLKSAGTNQHALIKLGGQSNGPLATVVTIDAGACP
ncbi:MAG: hypothetical protein V4702_05065 [Patescibacteria group bacterium]